ncbi:MAG: DUF2155 domain-containing protein [Pseudomonadota bacterium]
MNQERYPAKVTWIVFSAIFAMASSVFILGTLTAQAQQISNSVAVFSALDKVTARIQRLEVPINETIRFGSLKVTPKVCYSRPPELRPKTSTFVQVDEVQLNGSEKRIFSGWMFAESPALNAVEHPVYDVWLTRCIKPDQSVAEGVQREREGPEELPRRRRLRR